MKKRLLLSISLLSFGLSMATQRTTEWCGAHESFELQMKNNPDFAKNQQELETQAAIANAQMEAERLASGGKAVKKQSVVRIIPVVVHVIHANGTENISKAQIQSEIAALNRDFRRASPDTALTPGPFKSLSADPEIEFRMATLDPSGNCTDGINRIYSPMTVYARDNVKSLIYWPSNKYLNIWIVKSIRRADGSLPPAGTIIAGFAQFPGGSAATDGVVIAAANFGTIGTAQGNEGRTTVHEVGHWLNLRHIWGDDNGACSGSDMVNDTPNQASENFSTCPTFPAYDACTASGNGINYSNYMDYTDEACQNMFTLGQASRMNSALSSPTSGRSNLWSASNLLATGVTNPVGLCAAEFSNNSAENSICENGIVTFTDISFNAPIGSRTWTVNGGVFVPPSIATDSIVSVQYPTAGVYDVTLAVTTGPTTLSTTKQAYINVRPSIATYNGTMYTEGFETAALPNTDWEVSSPDNGNYSWNQYTAGGFSGASCAFIENYSADSADVDDLTGPTFNAAAIYSQTAPSNLTFTFQCAFAKRKTINNDALKILVSSDCGRTWTPRATIIANNLNSVTGLKTNYFIPTSTEWKKQTVSIVNVATQSNVRIKFQFTSGGGNNIYIDDINIVNTLLSVADLNADPLNLSIFPNPSNGAAILQLNDAMSGTADIRLTDVVGKEIAVLFKGEIQTAGKQIAINQDNKLARGTYFVKANIDGVIATKKLLIN